MNNSKLNWKITSEPSLASYTIIIFPPFLLYLLTICPTIYWRDSPEFVNVAYTLGISHPAGSPAYSIISKIFTFLPLFSIPFKINLVSLFFALLTIFFTCKVIQILLHLHFPSIKKAEAHLITILSSLFIITMPSFWLKSIVAEVYTMNAFFLVLILYILLKWSIKNDSKYILLAAFLYGLSSGVHAGVILFLPGFLVFFFLVQSNLQCQQLCSPKNNKEFTNNHPYAEVRSISPSSRRGLRGGLKLFTFICFFFLLGFSVYLYLPLRSITNTGFDWGNPETLSNFYFHISDKKDAARHFRNISNPSSLLKDFSSFAKISLNEITLIGLLLSALGMLIHFKKDLKIFMLLFLTVFINTLFYLSSTFDVYRNGILFIPSFLIFMIWIGLGICFIRNIASNFLPNINFRRLSVPLIIAFILFSFSMNYKSIEKSNYYLTDIFKEIYLDIDLNSIFFASQHWFMARYFQDVESLRPDLSIMHKMDIEDIDNPETRLRYPALNFPEIASTKDSFYDIWPQLINENMHKKKMFVDLHSITLAMESINIIPYKKFLMQIVDEEREKDFDLVSENYYKELYFSIGKDISQDYFFLDQKEGVTTYYIIFLVNFANYLRLKGDSPKALLFLKLAETLDEGKTKGVATMKAICLAELGRYNESVSILKDLLNEYPGDKSILTILGNLYLKIKDYKMAEKHLNEAIIIDENYPQTHFILGIAYSAQGRIDDGIVEIRKAINLSKDPLKRKKMLKYLKKVLAKKIQYNKP